MTSRSDDGITWKSREEYWLAWMQATSPWAVVAVARVVVAIFALARVYIDPGQPSHQPEIAYTLLAVYVAYALLLALLAFQKSLQKPLSIIALAGDVLFFGLIIYLTHGPRSPFFFYFIIPLFVGTLRWSWRGAAVMAAATIAIYAGIVIFYDDPLRDVGRAGIRLAFMIVVGILFAYFGWTIGRSRKRLAMLAEWPETVITSGPNPHLDETLGHIARSLGVGRLAVFWKHDEDSHYLCAKLIDGQSAYFCLDRQPNAGDAGGRVVVLSRQSVGDRPLFTLLHDEASQHAVVARFKVSKAEGALVLFLGRKPGQDLLPLAALGGAKLAAEIEGHVLRLQLLESAALQERTRLLRDIHDDLMQALAAVSIRMKSIEAELPPAPRENLSQVRQLLSDQQSRLRRLVMASRRTDAPHRGSVIEREFAEVVERLERLWRCRISFSVKPNTLVVSLDVGRALTMLVSEIVANGSRHGGATEFEVIIDASEPQFSMRIRDNGRGIPHPPGNPNHAASPWLEPASVRSRVEDLGWKMSVSNSPRGLLVSIVGALE